MKRKIASVLCCALACTTLAACGDNNNSANAVNNAANNQSDSNVEANANDDSNTDEATDELSGSITIATNMTNIVDTTLADMANEFMEAHPGTTIEYEGIKDYESVIATRVASGEAPDIYQVIDSMTKENMPEYFMSIDDLGINWDDIFFSKQNTAADGSVYAIADSVNYAGIVYNKAAFKAAGIDKVPSTMEEFMEDCAKLKEAGITAMGTAFKDVWTIYPWVDWNIEQITLNGNAQGKNLYIDSDEIFDETIKTSMGTIRELYANGYLEPDIMSANWDQLKVDLSSGSTAMYFAESWLPAQIVEGGAAQEDVGMFPFPGAKGIYVASGKSYGISKDCENPELAKAYLEFMIEGGKHAKACSTLPADKTSEMDDPFVAELLSYGVEPIECAITEAEFGIRKNEIELDEQALLMPYVMETDDAAADAMLEEWNTKWAEARSN